MSEVSVYKKPVMIAATMTLPADFNMWRRLARKLLQNGIVPPDVEWVGPDGPQSLFGTVTTSLDALPDSNITVFAPKAFIDIATRVICHRDPERFARLYMILWRLQTYRGLMSKTTDGDIMWLHDCDKAVRRDRHKMHAFVRFRKTGTGRYSREQFAAWFEPEHYITELATPFFMRRFPNMDWIIVTPDRTAIWDGKTLRFAPGGVKTDVPSEDAMDDHWRAYFRSIFNPARLKTQAMQSEMPKKYWKNLPEAVDIADMIETAQSRERAMITSGGSAPNPLAATLAARKDPSEPAELPQSLAEMNAALSHCTRCPLHCHASQAVCGEGPSNARIMVIGEQPGDREDIAGRPFVGPAGGVLDSALAEAGLSRDALYLTNAVKHFKFKIRGKRRIHDTPNASEIDHCRLWVETERALVKPDIIIALGASAARSVLGKSVAVKAMRGRVHALRSGAQLIITTHPSYILRLQNEDAQAKARQDFVQDLALAKRHSA